MAILDLRNDHVRSKAAITEKSDRQLPVDPGPASGTEFAENAQVGQRVAATSIHYWDYVR